jgi:hypothetical protein
MSVPSSIGPKLLMDAISAMTSVGMTAYKSRCDQSKILPTSARQVGARVKRRPPRLNVGS